MDIVLRAATIYFFLMIIFSVAGKRSLGELDTFDFVLILIIGESTQQAIIGPDYSLATALVLITTLVGLEIFMSMVGKRWPMMKKLTNGGPLVLVSNGKILEQRCREEDIDESDILSAARKCHGLERMGQIKFAILEMDGSISIIPENQSAA